MAGRRGQQRRTGFILSVAVVLGLCAAACGPDSDAGSIDLVAALPSALQFHERRALDLTTPVTDHLLVEGWSLPKESHRWAVGPRSSVRFFVSRPREIELSAAGRPIAADQEVRVSVNGRQVGVLRPEGMRVPSQVLSVPAEALRKGMNRLDLTPSVQLRPGETATGSKDMRSLSVAWRWIRWKGLVEAHRPRGEEGALILPPGTAVDFFVPAGRRGRLRSDEVSAVGGRRGAPMASLEVSMATDQSGVPVLSHTLAEPSTRGLDLEVPASRVTTRIRFLVAADARSATGSVRIVAPRLLLRSEPAAGEAAQGSSGAAVRPPDSSRPHIVLYIVDTLRADHVGAYGYRRRPTTPELDALAREGVLFERVEAQASWTRAGVASILSGLLPQSHRTLGRQDALPESIPTLATFLQDRGYQTMAVFTNGNASEEVGFDRGFDEYRRLPERDTEEIHQKSDRVHAEVVSWLEERDEDRPIFLHLHTVDPHDPYRPRSPYRERFAHQVEDPDLGSGRMMRRLERGEARGTSKMAARLEALYDAEIAYNDRHFGALARELKRRDLWDRALVVFTSDHGEEFLDHGGWTHARTLHTEMLQVPLVIKFPKGWHAGERVSDLARQIDVLPTVADWLGQSLPEPIEGRSLLPALEGNLDPEPAHAFLKMGQREIRSVRVGDFKLIQTLRDPEKSGIALFDLARDPRETTSVLFDHPVLAGYLEALLLGAAPSDEDPLSSAGAELSTETRRALEALGYL